MWIPLKLNLLKKINSTKIRFSFDFVVFSNFCFEITYTILNLGDLKLESGIILLNAKSFYITREKLKKENFNLIFGSSTYRGDHQGLDFIIN